MGHYDENYDDRDAEQAYLRQREVERAIDAVESAIAAVRRLTPSREVSIAITNIETGLRWLL